MRVCIYVAMEHCNNAQFLYIYMVIMHDNDMNDRKD